MAISQPIPEPDPPSLDYLQRALEIGSASEGSFALSAIDHVEVMWESIDADRGQSKG